MPDKKISQLDPADAPLAGTEVMAIVQSGATKKVTALELTGVNVTSDGRVGVGGVPDTTVNGAPITAKFGVHQDGGSTNYPVVGAVKYSDATSTAGVTICGARGRGSKATPTAVADGDLLSSHIAAGYDGTDFAISSRINYEVDGTPGNDDMPGRIVFLTAADGSQTPTERMRIGANGNVTVSSGSLNVTQVTDTSTLSLYNTNAGFSGSLMFAQAQRTSTSNAFNLLDFYNGDISGRFVVRDSGNAFNTTGTYGSLSDERDKENIVDASNKLNDVRQIKVRNFNLKGSNVKQIGVVAQELERIFPGLIDEGKNENGDSRKYVKYSVLLPILIKAVQEQQDIIDGLTNRITKIEGGA